MMFSYGISKENKYLQLYLVCVLLLKFSECNNHHLVYIQRIILIVNKVLIMLSIFVFVIQVPGDGGSQVEAKINKTVVPHYLCEKTSTGYFNIWLNLELLVPIIIDCFVRSKVY